MEDETPQVPESELRLTYARSGGKGGQNVNKRDTKAVLHWHVGDSAAFTEGQKAMIRAGAGKRLNGDDEVVMDYDSERSQLQNQNRVIENLQGLVAQWLTPAAERKETKVPRAEKRKRADDKKRHAKKKEERRSVEW